MANTIIEFKNINKKFGGIHAVKDVSFSMESGEIHTLIGENGAGKSTLMNMLSGLYMPTSGQILYKGKPVSITTPVVSKSLGITTVFQELKLCPNLTVVENIFLGRELKSGVTLNWSKMRAAAQAKLEELGMDIDVDSRVEYLSAAQMQLVEIAKAMFINSSVLILDEPTSSLTYKEAEKLFNIVNQLKAAGVLIIFISHRMEEVFKISDRISVMRNGEYLGTYDNKLVTPEKIVSLISNKDESEVIAKGIKQRMYKTFDKSSKIALRVTGLNRGKLVKNASFILHEGEILGLYGLEGSGRTELAETIYGLHRAESGKIELLGSELRPKSAADSIARGLAMLPEDRKHVGLFMNFDIENNIASLHSKDISYKVTGVLKKKLVRAMALDSIDELGIRTSGPTQLVKNLSGGNQQKVVIGKCLSIDPKVIIMDEPTRGVDVGAKGEIFDLLEKQRSDSESPKSLIVISSELEEVVGKCDRVLVLREGHIVGELIGEEITSEAVLQLSFNGSKDNYTAAV